MSIEAMKQALEALKGYRRETNEAAITALRAAIAEAVMQRLADVQQEIEQEPVAWMVTTEMQDGTRRTYPITGRYKDVCDACDFGEPIPLYTRPPRREWVGLTDDEIWEISQNNADDCEYVRAIMTALKEKNS